MRYLILYLFTLDFYIDPLSKNSSNKDNKYPKPTRSLIPMNSTNTKIKTMGLAATCQCGASAAMRVPKKLWGWLKKFRFFWFYNVCFRCLCTIPTCSMCFSGLLLKKTLFHMFLFLKKCLHVFFGFVVEKLFACVFGFVVGEQVFPRVFFEFVVETQTFCSFFLVFG